MKDFEILSRTIKFKASPATFKPDLSDVYFPLGTIESAEVMFGSSSALCDVIGFSALSYLLYIAKPTKSLQKKGDKAQGDVALRLMGTYLLDTEVSTKPVASLICGALQGNRLDKTLTVLMRESRAFDFTSMSYKNPLVMQHMDGRTLVGKVIATGAGVRNDLDSVLSTYGNFTLRWRPISLSNSRIWTRPTVLSEHVGGVLEVELPYIIFRGIQFVEEIQDLVPNSFLADQLRK